MHVACSVQRGSRDVHANAVPSATVRPSLPSLVSTTVRPSHRPSPRRGALPAASCETRVARALPASLVWNARGALARRAMTPPLPALCPPEPATARVAAAHEQSPARPEASRDASRAQSSLQRAAPDAVPATDASSSSVVSIPRAATASPSPPAPASHSHRRAAQGRLTSWRSGSASTQPADGPAHAAPRPTCPMDG